MICSLAGVVIALRDDGFLVQPDISGAAPRVVTTQLPGRDLDLIAGDRVSVLGGPVASGAFASGRVSKILPDGRHRTVCVNICDRPDEPD